MTCTRARNTVRQNRVVDSSRLDRTARGLVAAGIATFVALMSHVVAGGGIPGWFGLLVPLVLSAPVCILLAGRRLSLVRMTFAVAVSQAMFHGLFVLGNSSIAAPSSQHLHGAAFMPTDVVVTHGHAGATMWMGHAAAAILTTALLYFGERSVNLMRTAALRFAGWVRRALIVALEPWSPRPARLKISQTLVVLPLGVHPSAVSLRGPPLAPAF